MFEKARSMDHVVYLDAFAHELDALLKGRKTMIVRGGMGRKIPFGRVIIGDRLFFLENDGSGKVMARGKVTHIIQEEMLTPDQSRALIDVYQSDLQLSQKQLSRWRGKRNLVLIRVGQIEGIESFRIDRKKFHKMDDWFLVEDIEFAKKR
jgi:hypothetical protein